MTDQEKEKFENYCILLDFIGRPRDESWIAYCMHNARFEIYEWYNKNVHTCEYFNGWTYIG